MNKVITFPVVTAAALSRALSNSTLALDSVVVKTGVERVGKRVLAYADVESPRRPEEVSRVYIED